MQEKDQPRSFTLDKVCRPEFMVDASSLPILPGEALGQSLNHVNSGLVHHKAVDHVIVEGWI